MELSHKIASAMVKAWLKVFTRWEVRGKKNVPLNEPLIVVANHVHLLDPPLLVLSLPRWISFMAKEELFHSWFLGPIVRWAQAFPAYNKGTVRYKREMLKRAEETLENGFVLGMFPEGTRSRGGQLLPGHPGSVIIALKNDVSILPVGIIGTEKLKGLGWLWQRPQITVNIGQPFRLPSVDGKMSKAKMKLRTELIMREIAALLPPEHRGAYREAVGSPIGIEAEK